MTGMIRLFDDPAFIHALIGLAEVFGAGILGKILKEIMSGPLVRLIKKTSNRLDDRLIIAISKNVFALSIIAGAYFGIEEVRGVLELQRRFELRMLDYLTSAVYVLLILALARLVSMVIKALVEWYAEDMAKEKHRDISSTIPIASKITNAILITIAILIVLDHVGVNVGSLLVSLGVGSLAIALAAQETISNLIAWFVIVMDQPFRVGDQVRLSTGEEGNIHQIGLRATRILNYDNNIVVVPNGEIVKSRLINFSIPATDTRVLVELSVAYGTDLDGARKTMLAAAAADSRVYRDPAPQVYVMNFTDSGVLLRLAGRSNLSDRFETETSLRQQIYDLFRKEGIAFAVPQRISRIVRESDEPQASQTQQHL